MTEEDIRGEREDKGVLPSTRPHREGGGLFTQYTWKSDCPFLKVSLKSQGCTAKQRLLKWGAQPGRGKTYQSIHFFFPESLIVRMSSSVYYFRRTLLR